MKKTLATLSCALLAAIGLHAQNTALQFDGVDDFAFVTVNNPPSIISAESFTFEAIFKAMPNGKDMVILAAPQTNGDLLFGINQNGFPFTSYRGNTYTAAESWFEYVACTHIAITCTDRHVQFYLNGQPTDLIALNAPIDFTNQSAMYLGMNHPDKNTAFEGVLDEVRLWPQARTDNEIATWATITPYMQAPRFLLLPFWETQGTVSFDPYNTPYNYAYWLNAQGADMEWVETCIDIEYPLGERIGNGIPQACVPNINPDELICNGSFEQYDSILDTPITSLNGYLGNNPIWALQPDVNGYTDVINWKTSYLWPKFFVRSSYGSIPSQFCSWAPNTWDWNALGNNAMLNLTSSDVWPASNLYDAVETQLVAPLQAGETYAFEGWFYTLSEINDSIPDGHELFLAFSGNGNDYAPTNITFNNHNSVATNGGWQFISANFTVPSNLTGMNKLILGVFPTQSNSIITSYIDDVSIIPACGKKFPIGIALDTSHNQHMDRFMGLDTVGNIYVAGNSKLNGTDYGYFLAKYSPCGDTLWSHPVWYGTQRLLTAMEVTPDGKIFLGELDPTNNNATLKVINTAGTIGPSTGLPGPINDMSYNATTNKVVFTFGNNYVQDVSLAFSFGISQLKSEFEVIDVLECDATGNLYIAGWHDGGTRKLRMTKGSGTSPYGINSANIANIYSYQNGVDIPAFHNRMVQDIAIASNGDVWLAGTYANALYINGDSIRALSNNYPNNGYLLKYNQNLNSLLLKASLNDTITRKLRSSYISSIALDASDNLLIAGCFDTLYAGGAMYTSGSGFRLESYVLSLDSIGNFRWFEHTKNSGANGWPYTNENQIVIAKQPKTNRYIVTGNFYQSNTEIFEQGTLSMPNYNNVFIARLLDQGNDAFFKQREAETRSVKNESILIFPNPAHTRLTIATDAQPGRTATLYNLTGQAVAHIQLVEQQQVISVAHLPIGLYVLHIQSNGTTLATEKIVIR